MDPLPVLGLAGLLFVKEAGVPVPIPGDLLVLGAGVASAGSGAAAAAELIVILVAGIAGGSLQFVLVRGAFRRPLVSLLGRVGVSRERLESLADWLRRRGVRGVALARATPGLRIGAVTASGIAALPFSVFVLGLVAGNGVFVGGHFLLGYVIGPPAVAVIAGLGGIAIGVLAFVALAILGGVAWTILRRRGRVRPAGSISSQAGAPAFQHRPPLDLASVGSWADAACPACLAVTVAARATRTGG